MTDETTTARESLVAARKLRSCDRVILDALLDGSATAREISERVLMRSKEEWAARHDYFFEWDTDEEPLGAALLAHSEARKAGWVLMTWEIDGRLRALREARSGRAATDRRNAPDALEPSCLSRCSVP